MIQTRNFCPTPHPPGSIGKVDAMVRRYKRGEPLFHPRDAGRERIDSGREIMPEADAAAMIDVLAEADDEPDEAGSILDVDV